MSQSEGPLVSSFDASVITPFASPPSSPCWPDCRCCSRSFGCRAHSARVAACRQAPFVSVLDNRPRHKVNQIRPPRPLPFIDARASSLVRSGADGPLSSAPSGNRRQPRVRSPVAIQAGCSPTLFSASPAFTNIRLRSTPNSPPRAGAPQSKPNRLSREWNHKRFS
jgi:hypothetical protein